MSAWGTAFEIYWKQSRTSTCLRMWTDPSVYSTGNSTRTCWAFFLFLQQCKRGSGLREFPVRLIQPKPVQPPSPGPAQPVTPTKALNFTLARRKKKKKKNQLVKYWQTYGQKQLRVTLWTSSYHLAQLQPRLLYDWLSNRGASATKRKPPQDHKCHGVASFHFIRLLFKTSLHACLTCTLLASSLQAASYADQSGSGLKPTLGFGLTQSGTLLFYCVSVVK